MTKTKTYQTLTAGDVRKAGDEQRTLGYNIPETIGYTYGRRTRFIQPNSDWRSTDLVSHPILASDLIHLEFRRPL